MTLTDSVSGVIVNPSGSLSALTIAFPSGSTLSDGHTVYFVFTQSISTVTASGAIFGTAQAFPTSVSAGDRFTYSFITSLAGWYRIA